MTLDAHTFEVDSSLSQMQWARRTASEIRIAFEIHASWLNQVEIYFSVVQRKVLTPNDFTSLAEVEDRLLRFQQHYEKAAQPFEWKFTRCDLGRLLARLKASETNALPRAA